MSYTEILLLAFALSVDACVVSFSYGLCVNKRKRITSFLLALTTGFFQAFMPILGYFFTELVRIYIEPYSKWIVFLIFVYLGMTFILESIKKEETKSLCITLQTLLFIGIATSIDAFSAGISLSLTNSPLKFSALIIGIVTFINSLVGYWFGCGLRTLKANFLEILGGLILIFLGLKALI